MKPPPPLQFPKAAKPTSLHGVPVRSRRSPIQFPEAEIDTECTGRPALRLMLHPVSRANHQPPHRFLRNQIRYSARFPEGSSGRDYTGHPHASSSPRRPGCPARRCAIHGMGCFELMMPAVFARFPERRSPASRARGPSTNTASSHSFPCAHAVLVARLPMLGGTHFA